MFDFHDFISSWSHLLMAGFMTFVGLIMYRLTRHQPGINALSLVIYASSAVALFTLSGLFHGVRHIGTDDRRFWQLLDQSAIFGLIYGSNVPLLVYFLPPRRRNALLVIMGAIAIVGSMLLWTNPKHEILAISYVGIGLFGLIPMRTYFHYLRWWGSLWVLIMATTYILGAICEAIKWPVIVRDGFWRLSYHEMLHLFVIAGTLAHTILLIRYVIPTADWPAERRLPTVSTVTNTVKLPRPESPRIHKM